MKESSEFAKALAEITVAFAVKAKAELQQQRLLQYRMDNGKYDRTMLEHTDARVDPALDKWLEQLLIDAALERKDEASFLALTEPLVKGW